MESGSPARRKRKYRILIGVVLLLVVIRLILPYIVLHYANRSLETMHGYYGHINDIDLAIYRGAYKINNMYLDKVDTVTRQRTEFFDCRLIDLSVEWGALFHGKIVGELEVEDPHLKFTKDKVEPAQVRADTNDFRKVLDDFMPLKINRFEISNGEVYYLDHTSKPPVNIKMENVHIIALNLSSVVDSSLLPSSVVANADVYRGRVDFNMQLNALAKQSTFDMNASLNDTYLPDLNEFFKAYAKVDVNKGTFGLYTELAAADGKFTGYVKPVIRDLDVLGPEDRKDNILQKLWEGIAGTAGFVLKNQKENQIATKVPLNGTFKNADTDIWYAVIDLLRNAFIAALQPSIDYQINIASVNEASAKEEKKGLLKKVFSKNDPEPKKDRESRKEERKEKREARKNNK
jgi:hypothetical protein